MTGLKGLVLGAGAFALLLMVKPAHAKVQFEVGASLGYAIPNGKLGNGTPQNCS